jgi:hypothetical protein
LRASHTRRAKFVAVRAGLGGLGHHGEDADDREGDGTFVVVEQSPRASRSMRATATLARLRMVSG